METQSKYLLPGAIVVAGIIIAGGLMLDVEEPRQVKTAVSKSTDPGLVLPVTWGDLGKRMVDNGTIDEAKLKQVYERRGWTDEQEKLLTSSGNGKIRITKENAGYLLNLLWPLGLSSKNAVLDEGEMMDPRYGGPERFASTAGWVIAKGSPMDHYSKHTYFELTEEQQNLVHKVSKEIYRPCCRNSAHFPDCNHGMAMLGLLELLASQGADEEEMRNIALAVNSYWFPQNTQANGCGVEAGGGAGTQPSSSGCGV